MNPRSETTTLIYDDLNRLTKETMNPGQYTEFGYDSRNRQTSNSTKKADGTVFSTETYTYNDKGNLTQKVAGSTTTTYTYDNSDQLLTETRAGVTTTYTYDANGNRASKVAGGVTETYVSDDADKLTSITVGGSAVKSYGYDTAGRTTSVVTSAGTTSLTYDYEGRIATITYPSSSTNSFTYNGLDTRVGKVDSAGTTTYRRDGDDVLAPVLEAGSTKFTPGISRRTGSSSYFYHEDRLGSLTRQTSTAQGSLTARQYDAFGNVVATSGTWTEPFGFVGGWGYQEDYDSGLQLIGHRYYDTSTGRFLSKDPMKDGRNWFSYCENSPFRNVDPTGFEDWPGLGLEFGKPGYGGPKPAPAPTGGPIRPPSPTTDPVQKGAPRFGWGLKYDQKREGLTTEDKFSGGIVYGTGGVVFNLGLAFTNKIGPGGSTSGTIISVSIGGGRPGVIFP